MAGAPASTRTPPITPDGAIPTVAWASCTGSGLPGALELLDQTALPAYVRKLVLTELEDVRAAIARLSVRGAPAIGVAAAYGMVVGTQSHADDEPSRFATRLEHTAERLRTARPTAVNLGWAVDRCLAAAGDLPAANAVAALLACAREIHTEDEHACAAMGRNALPLLCGGGTYLTHCNTGRLATAGIGTAFGVFATAQTHGLHPTVYVGEVRPLLQGARLTAFELAERGIAGRLMPDGAAAALLRTQDVDAVFVGADRIAMNGDTANKIGTYGLAVAARENGVPFYVVAPTSTLDPSLAHGGDIPIEQRDAGELRAISGVPTAPPGVAVWNPAFDVTPASLISGIVTESEIARAPYEASLPGLAAS